MSQEARDSGISVDKDDDSMSTTSSNQCYHQLSYVQRLRKRFEILSKEQDHEFHAECNWWLEEEAGDGAAQQEEEVNDVRNEALTRSVSNDSGAKRYSKQSSIKSQISQDGDTKITVTPASPVKSPSTPREFPVVTFEDYDEQNIETNDSDSFDSDSDGETENGVEEVEEQPDLEIAYIRDSSTKSRLTRPASITSQTST